MSEGTAERWLPVIGHPGYEVSDWGHIRSIDRLIQYLDGHVQRCRGCMLTPGTSSRNHFVIQVTYGKTVLLHPLILEAFVGPRPEGMIACHWDDNPANNRLSNLRWATPSDNMFDRIRNGRHRQASQTSCIRGHRLIAPNLVPSNIHRGTRGCLACNRAGNLRRMRIKRGQPVGELQQLSDAYYVTIMGGHPDRLA